MITYQILFSQDFGNVHAPLDFIDVPGVDTVRVDGHNYINYYHCDLEIDGTFMLSRYHFHLTDEEVGCFTTHRHVWKMFSESGHEWCLVIEDDAASDIPFSKIIDEINELPPDWDIFCPFDGSKVMGEAAGAGGNGKMLGAYLCGFYWGSFAYFLSRRGADKLLNIGKIRQPVDEELIYLRMDGTLNSHIASRTFFHPGEHRSRILHEKREEAMKTSVFTIREAISNINVWSPADRGLVQRILGVISGIGAETRCDIILDSGTLLGYVRHGGIIPWDDDVDLAMEWEQVRRFIQAVTESKLLQWKIMRYPPNNSLYYKIWHKQGQKIDQQEYTFPFVDIWPYSKMGNKILFEEGRVFEAGVYYPFKEVQFENTVFKIPGDPMQCLDMQYRNWKRKVQIYPHSHRSEGPVFTPLCMPIEVDAEGRMI